MTIADERHRWSRVKAIFDATLQQPPEARTTFVEEACRDDSGLRDDVQSLLAAHETAGSFAERPAMTVLARQRTQPTGPRSTRDAKSDRIASSVRSVPAA